MDLEIFEIFPTPILKFSLGRDFTKEEIEFILEKEKEITPPPYEIHLGNNTTHSKRILEDPIMANLKGVAEGCLKEWCNQVYDPLYGDEFRLKVTQSWVNYTKHKEEHQLHYHPNSMISGVMYVNAQPENDMIAFSSDKKVTTFIQPRSLNQFNSKSVNFHVKTGDIILFPSDLSHHVPFTTGNYTRVSLAFNSFFEGRLGISSDIPNYIEFNNIK
jgi:uncharacterized protein (TIGR02466 family)